MSFNNRQIVIREANGQQDFLGLNNLEATAAPTINDDNTLDYAVGSKWIDVTNDEIYECVDSSTGAAVWLNTSLTDVEVAIRELAVVTGIDCTVAAQTALYTVPAGKNVYITEAIVELTTITGGTGVGQAPKISVGIGGDFDNIFSETRLNGLNVVTEFWHLNTTGVSQKGVATDVINFDVDTISNATAYTVTVRLYGREV